jgi:hypothetical protein
VFFQHLHDRTHTASNCVQTAIQQLPFGHDTCTSPAATAAAAAAVASRHLLLLLLQ